MDREVAIILEKANINNHATAPAMFTNGNQSVICRIVDGVSTNSDFGLLVYSTSAGAVKCCSYFINTPALPDSAKDAEILEYFFDRIHVTHGWELLSWGRSVTVHSTLWGNTVAMVGDYPVARLKSARSNPSALSQVFFTVKTDINLQANIQRAIELSDYCVNGGIQVGNEDKFEVIKKTAIITPLRPGVYLTTDMGKEHATQLVNFNIQDYQVQVIVFPIDTKILTSQYLDGLFGEAYSNCPSTNVFLQKYKIVGVNSAETRLLQWARTKTRWTNKNDRTIKNN